MVPGLTDDLVAQGARLGDPGERGVWCLRPEPLAPVSTGLQMLLVSRPLLEWYVRLRLLQDGRVEIRENSSVLDLAFSQDEARVVGVIVADRDGGVPTLVPAQLVVDASGRNSRTTEWLERRGYFAPPEDVRRVDKRYATHRVRPAAEEVAPLAVAVAARAGVPRSGILLAQEDGGYVVSLVGRGGVLATSGLARVRRLRPHVGQPRAGRRAVRDATAGRGRDIPLPRQPAAALGTCGPVPRRTRGHRRRVLRLRPGLRAGDDRGLDRGRGARPLPFRGQRPAGRAVPPGRGGRRRHPVDDRGRRHPRPARRCAVPGTRGRRLPRPLPVGGLRRPQLAAAFLRRQPPPRQPPRAARTASGPARRCCPRPRGPATLARPLRGATAPQLTAPPGAAVPMGETR